MSHFNYSLASNDTSRPPNQFYDVVLNSVNGTYATSGNVVSSMIYNMDWQAAMPDQAYHVYLSFISQTMNLTGSSLA